MQKYEYKFVEVKSELGIKVKKGDTFEKCKQIITEEALHLVFQAHLPARYGQDDNVLPEHSQCLEL